jgi:aldose 1-epimerase
MQLDIQVSVTNDHGHRMPLGIGWHPYFPVTSLCSVTTAVTHQWLLDDELFPLRKAAFRLAGFKPGRERLDTVFAGWDRRLIIRWPEKSATLSMQASSPYDYLVFYSPNDEFFCAEPVSNLPDAFNAYAGGADESGTRVLEPGATARASLSLIPEIESESAS